MSVPPQSHDSFLLIALQHTYRFQECDDLPSFAHFCDHCDRLTSSASAVGLVISFPFPEYIDPR